MLPQYWTEVIDESTGRTYYYHTLTQETTWDRPQENDGEGLSPKKKSGREKKREKEKDKKSSNGGDHAANFLDQDDLLELQKFVEKKKKKTPEERKRELEERKRELEARKRELEERKRQMNAVIDNGPVAPDENDDNGEDDGHEEEEKSAREKKRDLEHQYSSSPKLATTGRKKKKKKKKPESRRNLRDRVKEKGLPRKESMDTTNQSADSSLWFDTTNRSADSSFGFDTTNASANLSIGFTSSHSGQSFGFNSSHSPIGFNSVPSSSKPDSFKKSKLTQSQSDGFDLISSPRRPGSFKRTNLVHTTSDSMRFSPRQPNEFDSDLALSPSKPQSFNAGPKNSPRKSDYFRGFNSMHSPRKPGQGRGLGLGSQHSFHGEQRPSMQRGPSFSGRGVQRSPSGRLGPAVGLERSYSLRGQGRGLSLGSQHSFHGEQRPSMQRGPSFSGRGVQRGPSGRLGPAIGLERSYSQQNARPDFRRAQTMNANRPPVARQFSQRQPQSMEVRQHSMPMERGLSQRPFRMQRGQSQAWVNGYPEQAGPPQKPRDEKKKDDDGEEEAAPKSLVLIWLVVAGELGFDLGTTIIAFRSLNEESECCGYPLSLGPIPMSITAPFVMLVVAELALLIRAILLTLFPNIMSVDHDDDDEDAVDENGKKRKKRSTFWKWVCCCLRWKVRMVMRFLGFLVLLNPFFGCFIAWMLLYQSDKKESFTVLGLEGASLFLHFVSVYLEGAITNCKDFICQALVPLVPFLTSIGLVLFYLKQGGVCYSVERELFAFNGCEICVDGYPPVDGVCYLKNGTNITFESFNVLSFDNLNDFDDLTRRTNQTSYCAIDYPDGPDVNFCFFNYDEEEEPSLAPSLEPSQFMQIIANATSNATEGGL